MTNIRSLHIAAVLLLLPLIVRTGAHAQEQDDSARVILSPEVLVEAFRTPLGADSVPYAVTTLTARRAIPGIGLGEALGLAPGVAIDDRFNYAVGDRIAIRGFGARTQFGVRGIRVIADGIPATFADGQSALEIIDPAEIERAEIIRGPASSLHGNAAGGVLILRSSPPPTGQLRFSAGATIGSDGLFRSSSRIGGTNDAMSYTATLSHLGYEGYREYGAARSIRAGAQARFQLSPDDHLRISGGHVDFEGENPGALSDSLLRSDRHQAVRNNVRQKTGKQGEQTQLGLGWSHEESWGSVSIDGHWIDRAISNPIPGRIIDLDRNAFGARAILDAHVELAGMMIDAQAGMETELQYDDRRNFANADGERGALTLDQDEEVIGAAPFLQISVPLGAGIRAMGGIRYDRTLFGVTDRLVDTADPDDSGERMMHAVSPSLGILWRIDRSVSVYANVATAFETPTTTELANRPSGAGGFNPDLQPQRALSYETGARGTLDRILTYDIALYSARITNTLIPFQVPDFPGRDFFRNAGSATHRGAEAGITLSPLAGSRMRIAYSYTDARFDSYVADGKDLAGNLVPGVAPHRLEATLSYSAHEGWYAAADARHTGRIMTNDPNSASSPPYTLFNLRAGHTGFGFAIGSGPWRYRITPFAGITNLFDALYNTAVTVNAFGGRYYEPGPGRGFYAGVELGVGIDD